MRSILLAAIAVTIVSAAQQPVTMSALEPLDAKIKEELMGPALARIVLSEDGSHIAIVAQKQSGQTMIVDGVPGPAFDEIPQMAANSRGSMTFSRTGGRNAYIGRRGGDYFAVVDGKETMPIATGVSAHANYFVISQLWGFRFSSDGSHLAYPASEGAKWVMVVDGVKGPAYKQLDLAQFTFAGKRLIYVAMTDDEKWHAVVDGRPGPPYDGINTLTTTADGDHYVYFASSKQGNVAVRDGVEGKRYQARLGDLEMAPDGRIAYTATHGSVSLIVEGKIIDRVTTFNVADNRGPGPLRRVAWSNDHKRFATIEANAPGPGVTVKVNGNPVGTTYDGAGQLLFSPDGSRLHFTATSSKGTIPVVDGKELDACRSYSDFTFSNDGQHYAYFARTQNGGKIYLDGKEYWKTNDLSPHSLAFSPDGKRLVAGTLASAAGFEALIDGKAVPGYLGTFSTHLHATPPVLFPPIVFSPDGSRVAFVATKPDAETSVVVDGTWYPGATGQFSFPSFSPDSKRFAVMNWSGNGWAVMVDGMASFPYDDMLELSVGGCRFVDDHTFRFYGIKDKQVYRVTVVL
ncbi:MAG TPA: hypothetical protein VFV19_08855 [Candidatus Polarisedimenticolaceae bacterium]|nr:hypothetical protein [Candidatus Polarisedimenticolaceae bacterium]